ncbi:MAG: hypothetical protein Kow0090_10920 [Myxococcota bacterium]
MTLIIAPPLGFEISYPLHLASLAGALKKWGIPLRGLDLRFYLPLDENSLKNLIVGEIKKTSPQIAVLDASIRNVSTVSKIIAMLKEHNSDIPVIAVGCASAIDPELFVQQLGADAAITGDAEIVLPQLIGALLSGNIPALKGVAFKDHKGNIVVTPPEFHRLDDFPPADRNAFPLERYATNPLRRKLKSVAIEMTRGCPFNCSFCPVPKRYGRGWRARSAESAVGEMERLIADFGANNFLIEDEQPLARLDWFYELCALIRKHLPQARFEFPNGLRPELLDDNLLNELSSIGCRHIALGVESGVERVREAINRPIETRRLRKIIKSARRLGMIVSGYFIIGLPEGGGVETSATLLAARRLPFDYSHISVFRDWERLGAEEEERARRLSYLRGAGYLCIYASPTRAMRLIRRGEISLSNAPFAFGRFAEWLFAGSIGGGGW